MDSLDGLLAQMDDVLVTLEEVEISFNAEQDYALERHHESAGKVFQEALRFEDARAEMAKAIPGKRTRVSDISLQIADIGIVEKIAEALTNTVAKKLAPYRVVPGNSYIHVVLRDRLKETFMKRFSPKNEAGQERTGLTE